MTLKVALSVSLCCKFGFLILVSELKLVKLPRTFVMLVQSGREGESSESECFTLLRLKLTLNKSERNKQMVNNAKKIFLRQLL